MNRIAHFEIHATNPKELADFYRGVFGWEIESWKNDYGVDYLMVMTGKMGEPGGINGGMVKRMGAKPKNGQNVNAFVCTVTVDDLGAYTKKILAAKGKIALPEQTVPGVGRFTYFNDPDGNLFGVMQTDPGAMD